MSCERYKKALSEAAAAGEHWPNAAVREHLNSCPDCGEFFAAEQALFSAIESRASERANAEPSSAFLARVHALVSVEPAPNRNWRLWAPVAAAVLLAVGVSTWVVRQQVGESPQLKTISASVSLASRGEDVTPKTQPILKTKHGKISEASVRNTDFHPLVPADQPAMINRLIKNIRTGEIDGKILLPPPNQDLKIAPIVIPPVTVDTADETSDRISVTGPSLESNRRTR